MIQKHLNLIQKHLNVIQKHFSLIKKHLNLIQKTVRFDPKTLKFDRKTFQFDPETFNLAGRSSGGELSSRGSSDEAISRQLTGTVSTEFVTNFYRNKSHVFFLLFSLFGGKEHIFAYIRGHNLSRKGRVCLGHVGEMTAIILSPNFA